MSPLWRRGEMINLSWRGADSARAKLVSRIIFRLSFILSACDNCRNSRGDVHKICVSGRKLKLCAAWEKWRHLLDAFTSRVIKSATQSQNQIYTSIYNTYIAHLFPSLVDTPCRKPLLRGIEISIPGVCAYARARAFGLALFDNCHYGLAITR